MEFKQWPNYNAVADKCLKLPGVSDKIVTAKKLKKEAPKAAAKEVDMASGDMKLKEEADKSADDKKAKEEAGKAAGDKKGEA